MNNYPKPSELMRKRRPDLYSDSSKANAYTLHRSEFSYILDTLTERNQHKDFETFCRHLCERVLCPNLRTQTGPDGGGDGKVDTETYAVSDEIAQRWYAGEANARNERWGFAISAKKTWLSKVRSDVKRIVETGRKYDRIFFLTSRPVRANKCHEAEQNLFRKYRIPVTILDREWIIEQIIGNGFEDISYNDLGAGSHDPSKIVIGPNDHERNQRLSNIEARILRLGSEISDQTQLVSDTIEAAKLSRELERPYFETEGRFKRAIDTAITSGSHSQILRAKYEYGWTMFWWYDDVEPLNGTYEDIEKIVSKYDSSADYSKLCNFLQVLEGRVFQGWETSAHLDLDARRKRIRSKLFELSQDKSRPNNALHAETLLVLSRLNKSETEGNGQTLDNVWSALADIVDRAKCLAEYPAEILDKLVEKISPFVPESAALDNFAERLAEFMGQRKKDGKAGKIYFSRGEGKLNNELPIEAVSWLGRASVCFMKEEFKNEQFKTLYYLATAYTGAGLLWASRAVCLAALVQVNAISNEDAEIKMEIVPTVLLLARVSLRLGHIPDLLSCIFWLRELRVALPISNTSKSHLDEEIFELDRLLSCFLAGMEDNVLAALSDLPDILEALFLFHSKIILMYRLGRAKELKRESLMPDDTDIAELANMVNAAASHPACYDLPKVPRLNGGERFLAQTSIIGVHLEFTGDQSTENILLCEACMAAIESFSATAFSNKIYPKTKKIKVVIKILDDLDELEIAFDPVSTKLNFGWPKQCSVLNTRSISTLGKYLLEFCIYTLDTISFLNEADNSFQHMITNEKLFSRTTSFSFAHFSQKRITGKYLSSIDDFLFLVTKSHPPVDPLPKVISKGLNVHKSGLKERNAASNRGFHSATHNDINIKSVINTHLWDRAGWKGMIYSYSVDFYPPFLGLFFENREMASAIFEEWNDEFGLEDVDDRIRISIIRGINSENVNHYRVHIGHSVSENDRFSESLKTVLYPSRLHTMRPDNSRNLEGFLERFERFNRCVLIPAVGSSGRRKLELLLNHSILIRNLHIRQACEIGVNDEDIVAVGEGAQVRNLMATE